MDQVVFRGPFQLYSAINTLGLHLNSPSKLNYKFENSVISVLQRQKC